jgi:hypothetical protein
MTTRAGAARLGAATLVATVLAACSSLGSLGSILGGGGPQEVDGTVRGVDSQNQAVSLQQSNGQSVALQYDDQTRVIYQNQDYPVTALDAGDQVAAFVEQTQNGGYYADSLTVVQPVNSSVRSGALQEWQGTVRSLDRSNRTFTLVLSNGASALVSLPYSAGTRMLSRFSQLRNGDYVTMHGVVISTNRIELRHWN